MGFIRHHAILVTGWENLDIAREIAIEFGNNVSDIVAGPANGYFTFMIAPDGSKEGWETSRDGDDARERFIRWLNGRTDDEFEWVELYYGHDDGAAKITNHAWESVSYEQ
jgi:hypothetical protein